MSYIRIKHIQIITYTNIRTIGLIRTCEIQVNIRTCEIQVKIRMY